MRPVFPQKLAVPVPSLCRLGLGALAACAAAAGTLAPAPAISQTLLDACRTAARQAEEYDPTNFKCDWRSVIQSAPGGALTGRFAYQRKGYTGGMTILDGATGPALIAIHTVNQRNADSCTLQLEATRQNADALVGRTALAPGCAVRVRSTRRNVVEVESTNCQQACGPEAMVDGTYWLPDR